jgi:hypothetical protein
VTIKRLLYHAAGLREEERENWDASARTRLNASVKDWNRIPRKSIFQNNRNHATVQKAVEHDF